jgi:hypothetical protein
VVLQGQKYFEATSKGYDETMKKEVNRTFSGNE